MKGKSKCKILKDIRHQIAKDNDIEYVTSECKFQGECFGTCPKCEAELRYLEEELMKRQKAGKKIAVVGVAAAFMVGASGCGLDDLFSSSKSTMGDFVILSQENASAQESMSTESLRESSETDLSEYRTMGEPALEESQTELFEKGLIGVPEESSEDEFCEELTGDVVFPD